MRRLLIVAGVVFTFCVAAAPSAGATVLLGDLKVESSADTNGNGVTQAFSYTAVASGTPSDVQVYVGSNSASGMQVGIYSDSGGTPSRLLASGTLSAPAANAWNDVKLGGSPPGVTSGTKYWISLGGTGSSGLLYFRDVLSGGTASYAANGLPSTWSSTGGPWPVGPASAYVNGTTTSASPPTNTGLPTISGTTQQGQTLSTTTGTWTNNPTAFAYQWEDCDSTGANCTSISGATTTSYTLTSNNVGHTIRVVVIASNSAGQGTATSNPTATITASASPPNNTGLPTITGTTQQGQTLSTTNGTWNGTTPITYTYQWQRCTTTCSNITGATSSTYTLTTSDVGDTIDVIVTATNSAGNASATSAKTATITASPVPPSNTGLPTISGTTQQGQTLSTTNGTWNGTTPITYTYQWQRCTTTCSNITGATSSTYTLTTSDVGDTIKSVVTATNAGGSGSASSAAVGPVTVPSSGGGCGTAAPGASQTVGGTTYSQEGVDNFTKNAPVGSFAESTADQVVYTGDGGMGWTEYPDGWSSTNSGSAEGYQPSTVQSVHDGTLDFYLHNDMAGNPVGANPSPLPGGNRYQTYGAWSFCEKIVPDSGSNLADFHHVPLLWPQNDADWQSAESDFPEGDLGSPLTSTSMDAFAHYGGSGSQDDFGTGTYDATQWHVFTQTWGPSGRSYYMDGRLLGTSTRATYSGLERFQFQMEPSGSNNGGHGHVYVDWVWIGTPGGGGPPPPPGAPVNTTLPSISGTPAQGSTLTASQGSWTNSPTSFSYQWQRCSSTCSNITGATSSTYTLTTSDVGDTIDVIVTATNSAGNASATSAKTRRVR